MSAKLRLVFSISILFFSFYGFAQQNPWRQASSPNKDALQLMNRLQVEDAKQFSVDENTFRTKLKNSMSAKAGSDIVYFPDEQGQFVAFRVWESSVMAPELAAKYPGIRSYEGQGVAESGKRVRFSISHKGIQSMISYQGERRPTFMQKSGRGTYVVYQRNNLSKAETDFICKTGSDVEKQLGTALRPVNGQVLRQYRLAVSATGEYTDYHGGTVADALAAINATVTRINAVFETDLAVRLVLVANTDEVIYTDSSNDPYTGNLNTQAQNTLTDEIGESNYDIGHLFNRDQNNGNAGFIGAICIDGQKGSAFSSGQMPEGDVFDLDFVAHEIGHQLGANHTWSFESEGTQVQAEPGSGTTIMGYAGITGNNNVALNSDDYFHYNSIVQIIENLESKSCGEALPLTNSPPVVSAIPDYAIPKSTAFALTGNATDSDSGDVLSYTWEQIDDGVVTQASFGPANPSGANFRSLKPGPDPIRYFPRLSRVLAGELTETSPTTADAWETVSDVERELNFALTVRDNANGGGQVTSELVKVQVVNAAGPFILTSQESAFAITAGEVLDVTWDVANTDKAPINAQNVDILLSLDGGLTFSLLSEGVLNDGSHSLIVPGTPTTNARIMVRAQGNVFFAVNAADFTIEAAPVVLSFSDLSYDVCQTDNLSIPFNYETFSGFNEESTFSISAPPGLDVTFTPETATTNDTEVTLAISNVSSIDVGGYDLTVIATSAGQTKEVPITLNVFDDSFSDVALLAPEDGAADVTTSQLLQWEASTQYTSYDLEIATDIAFTNIVETASVVNNGYTPISLQNETSYFWRVRPKNSCGEGTFGSPFSFTTIQFNCTTQTSVDTPIVISTSGTPTVTSKISFFEDLQVADIDVNLELDHTFLADLVITLTSPAGTSVTLISNSCGDLQNIDVTFNDDADSFQCSGNPAISGNVRPLGALSSFNGESIFGDWILEVSDTAPADGGSLRLFSMNVCVEGEFSPDEDNDGVFDSDDLCPGTSPGQEVDVTGCPVYRLPSDNFELWVQSESCRSNNDGQITIATDIELEYTVTVSGGGLNISEDFNANYTLDGLSAGNYTLCVNASDGLVAYQEICFEAVVSEPEALNVTSKIDATGNLLVLFLEGADVYTIDFNGEALSTKESEVVLDLQKGSNSVKVTTDLPCQGSYEEQFFRSDGLVVYPNPFVNQVAVNVQDPGTFVMEVFSMNGQRVLLERKEITGVEASLDVSNLAAGTYFLRIQGATQNETVKLIKQ